MASRTATELKDLTDGELFDRLAQTKDDLFHLRFQHATGQLEKTTQLGVMKKQVARINTELRDREIAAAEALAAQQESAS